MSKAEFLSYSIYELVQNGVFSCSPTVEVLKTHKPSTKYIEGMVKSRLLTSSYPIFGSDGNLEYVVAYSAGEEFLHELLSEKNKSLHMAKYLRAPKNEKLVAASSAMKGILAILDTLADVDTTILLTGESGTGKEVLAEYIYEHSRRRNEVFIPINCAALPSNLIESELFGYKRGAFTGANKEGKPGLFELADNGTVFLDEIGDISLDLQAKLLRVLEVGEILPLGSDKVKKVNVRIIAATNNNLLQKVQEGTFRQDLFYRLSVLPIRLPPLRERKDDILPLAELFLDKYNKKYKLNHTFSDGTLKVLYDYNWPGNIRELRNVVERLCVTATSESICITNLDFFSASEVTTTPIVNKSAYDIQSFFHLSYKEAMRLFETLYVENVLEQCDHNITKAAKRMKMNRSGLYYILKKGNNTSQA